MMAMHRGCGCGHQGLGKQDPPLMRLHRKAKLPAGEGRWHPQAHARTPDLQRAPPPRQGLLETASKGETDPKPAALTRVVSLSSGLHHALSIPPASQGRK